MSTVKNDNTEVIDTVIIDEPTKESVPTRVKNFASRNAGKIKIVAAALAGAATYAVVTSLTHRDVSLEIESGEDFAGSDEETVALEITEI